MPHVWGTHSRRRAAPRRDLLPLGGQRSGDSRKGGGTHLAHLQLRVWSTSLFFLIHGIIERSLPPTCSIGWSAMSRRRDSSVGAPARFSRMKSRAYSPLWMRVSASRIAHFTSSVMIFGPVTYSPYSALFEIE